MPEHQLTPMKHVRPFHKLMLPNANQSVPGPDPKRWANKNVLSRSGLARSYNLGVLVLYARLIA